LTYEIRPIESERASAYKVSNETPPEHRKRPANPS